jgi:hypothetical protein
MKVALFIPCHVDALFPEVGVATIVPGPAPAG